MDDGGFQADRGVADYISTVTAELAPMAASNRYTVLAYLLEMARLESERLSGRGAEAAQQHYDQAAASTHAK